MRGLLLVLAVLLRAGAADEFVQWDMGSVFEQFTTPGGVHFVPDLSRSAISETRAVVEALAARGTPEEPIDVMNRVRTARHFASTLLFREMDKALLERGFSVADLREIEGHTGLCLNKTRELLAAVTLGGVRTYCEIGFNAGHSAVLALTANPELVVYSFDLGSNRYTHASAQVVQEAFPGRVQVILGDSRVSVPTFHKLHPDVVCDVVLVDGGHSFDVAKADLLNMWAMTNQMGNVVLLDDHHLRSVLDAGHAVEAEGLVSWQRSTEARVCFTTRWDPAGELTAVPSSCEGEVTGMLQGVFVY